MKNQVKIFCRMASIVLAGTLLSGCGLNKIATGMSEKNISLSGYVTHLEMESMNPGTFTPQGKLIFGRVDYRSRKVGIPGFLKVPNAGYFRASRIKSIFGGSEIIIEYDWTAGSDAEAKKAAEKCRELMEKSQEIFAQEEQEEEQEAQIKQQQEQAKNGKAADASSVSKEEAKTETQTAGKAEGKAADKVKNQAADKLKEKLANEMRDKVSDKIEEKLGSKIK